MPARPVPIEDQRTRQIRLAVRQREADAWIAEARRLGYDTLSAYLRARIERGTAPPVRVPALSERGV